MEIKFDVRPKGNNITLVVLRGEIGIDTVEHFKEKFEAIINEGKKRLIVDMQEVTFLSPMGLGVIASTLRKVKRDNGNIKFINPSSDIHSMLELTRMTKVFEIFDSEESAIKSFS